MLIGVNTPSYNIAGGTFKYNGATDTATWTLPAAIGDDNLLLQLDGDDTNAITDHLGNRLDGDWTFPIDTTMTSTHDYPSGDGVAGADFRFRFDVLPGNVSQDGFVQALDGLLVRGRGRRRGRGQLLNLQGR